MGGNAAGGLPAFGKTLDFSMTCGNRAGFAADAASARESRALLLAPALHRGSDAHAFAIFCDRAPGDVDPGLAQLFHNGVVGKNFTGRLRIDEMPDPMPNRFSRMCLAAIGCR